MKTPSIPTGKTRWISITVAAIAVVCLLLFCLLRDSDDDGVLRLYGNVDIREVELAFRQPCRLASMAYDEGGAVSAGKVLAQLDAVPYRDALAVAEAGLRVAKAELDKLRSGNRPQEITQAQERVSQTQAAFHEVERNFKRQYTLLESGASSQRTVDAARAARDQAAANLAAAKAALSLATAGPVRDGGILPAEAPGAGHGMTRHPYCLGSRLAEGVPYDAEVLTRIDSDALGRRRFNATPDLRLHNHNGARVRR